MRLRTDPGSSTADGTLRLRLGHVLASSVQCSSVVAPGMCVIFLSMMLLVLMLARSKMTVLKLALVAVI
jgi:hypothetical protein